MLIDQARVALVAIAVDPADVRESVVDAVVVADALHTGLNFQML